MNEPLLYSEVPGLVCRRGKVRDNYDLGDRLAVVATDRISAFDWVLPTGIPDKGRILTSMTLFWLNFLKVPNHLITTDVRKMGGPFAAKADVLQGRTMLVHKAAVVPIECVARGYLAGSGWKEYRQHGTVCGQPLPSGLVESSALPEAIFTPATKAESGHDENISFEAMAAQIGRPLAHDLKARTLAIYQRAKDYAKSRGVILADTKLEWGQLPNDEIILIDEVLTPDSSRFWPANQYQAGKTPPSYDKQFVRDWLEQAGWDKSSEPPALPEEVVIKTREKYMEAFERLCK